MPSRMEEYVAIGSHFSPVILRGTKVSGDVSNKVLRRSVRVGDYVFSLGGAWARAKGGKVWREEGGFGGDKQHRGSTSLSLLRRVLSWGSCEYW